MCKGALKKALIKRPIYTPDFFALVHFKEQKIIFLFTKPAAIMQNQTYV
jgi:hypothetical protein